MFLAKIWFVLVGLLAGVAVTAAFVAPRPADRRIEQLEGQRLDRAQYAAEQMLKTDAHRWIDYVAKLGRDAVISESLDSASRGAGEPRMLHETVRNRLKALVPDLGNVGLTSLGALDVRGRVVARVGDQDREYGESIAGAEVISDALRGYLSDDVWGSGGRIQRIAAAPVLSKTKDRIVGVLYVGAETGKRLAELWQKNLSVDVAILLKKQVLSATLSEALLSNLSDHIEQRKAEIAGAKRTRPISLPAGSERLIAVAAPFAGQAGEQDAYYVLIGKKAPASDPFALLSSTAADDLKWGRFPWLPLAGGVIVILAVGLWLQRYEMEGPLSRLRKDLQKLARGEAQKIEDTRYSGKFGGIARDVNAAMERYTHNPAASRSDMHRKDLNALLDGGTTTPGGPPDHRITPPPFTPPPPSASVFAGPLGGMPSLPTASPFAPQRLGSPAITPPTPGPFTMPGPRPAHTLTPPVMGGASPFSVSPPRPTPAPPPRLPVQAASEASIPVRLTGEVRVDSSESHEGPSAFGRDLDDERTGELGKEEKTRAVDAPSADEAHIREVFAEYMAARQRTGEAPGSLTLEKFRARLETNKQQLVAKYNCRTARFSVYIKDGKAAIKATPVRD